MSKNAFVPVAVIALFALPAAHARTGYVNNIPNGTVNSCRTCHNNSSGGSRNAFGLDYVANNSWAALFDQDSDSDGQTNGQ